MPLCTLVSVLTVARIARLQPITVRRKLLRATSIFLASEISCSRVKSGISAIWLKYSRMGSLDHLGGGSSGSTSRSSGAPSGEISPFPARPAPPRPAPTS